MHMLPVIKMHLGAAEGVQSPSAASCCRASSEPTTASHEPERKGSCRKLEGRTCSRRLSSRAGGRGWDGAFHLRFGVFSGDTQRPLANLYVRRDMNVRVYVHQCVCTPPQSGYYDLINMKVKVAQSSATLCDPMDYTLHGILQTRILEWVVFPFSRELYLH